ncbi:MAG: TetR/AcrR family transcriptional regulator [Quisquiliibacterium sp.]
MPRAKAADYDEHRARILRTAVQEFARIGYPSASMANLAQACGTSKAALYHYFANKEALLHEALDGYTLRLRRLVTTQQSRRLSPHEELAAIVRELVAEYRSSQAYHVALLNDVKFLDPQQRERIRGQERDVVDAIASSLQRAYPQALTLANRRVVTMALLGMINFTFAWLRPDGPVSHDQFAELVLDLWSQGLNGALTPFLEGSASEQAVRIQG